jgi:hypothetical protein
MPTLTAARPLPATLLVAVALTLFTNLAWTEESKEHFDADPKIQKIAEAYSLDMVDFAKQRYSIQLDWSDDSVKQVERIGDSLHHDYVKDHPSAEEVAPFYKMMGSYIGEVFRRNHHAEWGWVTLQGKRFPGMHRDPIGLFWPWGKAQSRIVNGSEDNLGDYYRSGLLDRLSGLGHGEQRELQ